MFRYLEKHSWWVTLEEKQVATIDELITACKSGDVERVIIPMTGYYYGASLIDDSNNRSIQSHYPKARFKNVQGSLTMSASQFLRNEHYREFVEELQEQYPIFDEQDYSNLESETKLEFLVGEIAYALENEDTIDPALVGATLSWTKEKVRELLESGEWDTRIEWWEHVEIDTDGTTPYADKAGIELLVELVKEKAHKEDTK